ncbi:MAG TPA: hypothetical protein VMF58_10375, partial [Rhizomicrobium sp.]|nr:hypothetical protein [Rhizomicrobium sp.]
MERLDYIAKHEGRFAVTGVPGGYDSYLAAEAAKRRNGLVVFVAGDDMQAAAISDGVRFFAPDVQVLSFPAWDCLPYDRVSPKSDTESERLATLAALAQREKDSGPAVVVTVINAILQRVPPREAIEGASFFAKTGATVGYDKLAAFLAANGYVNASTVREPGDFALRGGIVDLWPPGSEQPLRLDFFGQELDAIRRFDAETQLSADKTDSVELLPASEAPLDPASISRFRSGYVARFGPATSDDPLYESVSAGRKQQGMEHWLPLFHDHLDTLFDFVPDALILLAHQTEEAKTARLELIADYYDTRREMLVAKGDDKPVIKAPPYKPLPPDALYLTDKEWAASLSYHRVRDLSPFQAPESMKSVDAGGRTGRDFAPERQQTGTNVFEVAAQHVKALQASGKRALIASWSEGSAERMGGVLSDHGLPAIRRVKDWPDALKLDKSAAGITCLEIEHGFETP